MKKQNKSNSIMRSAGIAALLLAAAMILPLSGCAGGKTVETTMPDTTADPEPGTAGAPDSTTAEPEPATSETPETSAPDGPQEYTVTLKWKLGYVGSSTHSTWKNTLNPSGGYYSYSEIFTVPCAGSTIKFTDDNKNSNGDSNFASASAYVFSSWKETSKGVWVIDLDGYNVSGTEASYKDYGGARTYAYTTKKDNENIRISFRSGQTSSFTPGSYPAVTVTGNEPAAAVYEIQTSANAKNDRLFDLASWKAKDVERAYFDNLKGLTVNFIGDSYFAGDGIDSRYVWPALLGRKYDQTTVNQGKNGSAISDYDSSKNPMCKRYASLPDNNPDVVVLQGGKNDYNVGAPLGEIASTDTKTFCGAVRTTIEGLRSKYPNAVIVCVTLWEIGNSKNSIGLYGRDYGNAMISVCNDMGVPCINAMSAESGVIMTDASFRAQYCRSSGDISHLNAEGHALALQYFEKQLSEKIKK